MNRVGYRRLLPPVLSNERNKFRKECSPLFHLVRFPHAFPRVVACRKKADRKDGWSIPGETNRVMGTRAAAFIAFTQAVWYHCGHYREDSTTLSATEETYRTGKIESKEMHP